MISRPALRLLAMASAVIAASLAIAGPAAALTPTITEFSAGLSPGNYPDVGIAPGPDGNVWFVVRGASPAIGRITPAGAITEFSKGLNAGAQPAGMGAGLDGNLWFADPGSPAAIGRITPSGEIREFSAGLNAGASPGQIAGGPDGNVWFTDNGPTPAIGRITPAGAITEFSAGLNAGSSLGAITAGPDGNLWFADGGITRAIGRITPAGAITEFSAGLGPKDNPYGIAPGADGNIWFSDSSGSPDADIGRVTTTGAITKFSSGLIAASTPYFIAAGPDGALWFTDEASPTQAIGRITTAGGITEFSTGLNPMPSLYGISPGPDGNVWFTDNSGSPAVGRITTPPAVETGGPSVLGAGAATVSGTLNGHSQLSVGQFRYGPTASMGAVGQSIDAGSGSTNLPVTQRLSGLEPSTTYHYRLEATNPTGTTPGAERTFTTLALPVVRALTVRPKVWRQGARAAAASKRRRRVPVGTRIIFKLNRATQVRLQFFLKRRGHRAKSRLRAKGSLALAGHSGRNIVRFQGRLSKGRGLKPGSYRLEATAEDPTTPTRSSTRAASFTMVGRR